jgi:hypothetical protein
MDGLPCIANALPSSARPCRALPIPAMAFLANAFPGRGMPPTLLYEVWTDFHANALPCTTQPGAAGPEHALPVRGMPPTHVLL